MFKKDPKGFWFFEELNKFDFLVHGISSKKFGSCRPKDRGRKNFLSALGMKEKDLVLGEQVHKDKIKVARNEDKSQVIAGVDGLLTKEFGLVLGVRTADCLPIVFYEPEAGIIGVAHAGWRGVLKRLPQKMIDQIIRMGGLPENILVAIGPHICQKCYSVDKTRISQFIDEFGKLRGMVKEEKYLDLFLPTKIQLRHSGVLEKNIFHSGACTSCQTDEFFSYRKSNRQNYGEILTVISLKV